MPRQIQLPNAFSTLRNFGITASRRLMSEVSVPDSTLSGTNADTVGHSFQALLAMPGHFDAVRIVFHNAHSSGYNTKIGLYAASKSDVSDATNVPAALIGTQTVAIAAGAGTATTAAALFTNTASTWIPINSIDRTDGGTLPLLGVRCYVENPGGAGGTTTTRHNGGSVELGVFNGDCNGQVWYNRKMAHIDAVTTPANYVYASTSDAGGTVPCFTVQARMRGGAITVLGVGDSTMSGINLTATGRWNNYLFRACDAVSKTTRPVIAVNQGISGQTSANFLTNGETMVASILPDIAIYTSATVNDGVMSAANLTASIGRVYEFIEYCRTRGIIPIITTMWPKATGVNAYYAQFNASIRSMSNVYVLDVDSICGTGATDNRVWLSNYSADNIHPSAIAEAAIYPVLAGILNKIISANGI